MSIDINDAGEHVWILPMARNGALVCVGDLISRSERRGWAYDSPEEAVAAAIDWDGNGVPAAYAVRYAG